MLKHRWPIVVLLWLLLGCGNPFAAPPIPTPTPQAWLDGAVQQWNESQSFHFSLELEGRTVALDESGTLAFSEAEGDVVLPDTLRAVAMIKSPLGAAKVGYVVIGEEQWLTNPLNGKWEKAPPSFQTDVRGLFDAQEGIGALLGELDELERAPDEQLDGMPMVHLTGSLPGQALTRFASDLAEVERVQVDLWIGQDDQRLHQIVMTEVSADGKPPIWTFRFSQFDALPTIEPPL